MENHHPFAFYYELAKDYYKENGNLYIPVDYVVTKDSENYNLGAWVKKQRDRYLNKSLSDDCIALLNKIGMIWIVRDYKWEQMYHYAIMYYQEHNNLDVPATYKMIANGKSIALGPWITDQRNRYRDGRLSIKQKELLEKLNIRWRINYDWEEVYKIAKDYYEKHGNLFVPNNYEVSSEFGTIRLANWLRNQKSFYQNGRLSPTKIKLLKEIDFFMNREIIENEQMIRLLKNYINEYKKAKVPVKYVVYENGKEYKIGRWVERQRKKYEQGIINDEIIQLFNELSIKMVVSRCDWNDAYLLACEFYDQYHHLRIPRDYVVKKGNYEYNLGLWIGSQRNLYHHGKLTENQIALLEKISIEWRVYHKHLSWDEAYSIAKEYYNRFGNINITDTNYQELNYSFDLQNWLNRQKVANRDKKLDSEKIRLLNEIGIVWERKSNHWENIYSLAKEYFEVHHNIDIPIYYVCSINNKKCYLGKWIEFQKTQYRDGALSKKRIMLLEKLNINWETEDEIDWDIAYPIAKRFYLENGHLSIPIDFIDNLTNIKVGKWLYNQKKLYEKHKLPMNKVKLLKEIGCEWGDRDILWLKMYSFAETLFDMQVDLNHLKNSDLKNSEELSKWILSQKNKYRNGSLSSRQKDLLEKIGISFNVRETNWDTMYFFAKRFYEENGHLFTKNSYSIIYNYKSVNLGAWVLNQRKNYQSGKLSQDQIQKLEKIGMVWDTSKCLEEIITLCEEYGINYSMNKTILKHSSPLVLLGKILWLMDNDLEISHNNHLHPIFSMSSIDIMKNYMVTIEELISRAREYKGYEKILKG